MPFADKLKRLRQEHNMTQQNLADRIQVARSTITGYETKGRQPSHEKLTAIATLFQVSVDYLLDEDDTIEISVTPPATFPAAMQALVNRYQRLTPRSRKNLLEYLQLLEMRDREEAR
jgi:transcriptional regulator with XRE-family HTH domain